MGWLWWFAVVVVLLALWFGLHMYWIQNRVGLPFAVPDLTLPNGLTITPWSQDEAMFLYYELFEADAYGKRISVRDGDIVFDVGANIGLFSLALGLRHRNLQIYGFEPITQLHRIATINTNRGGINGSDAANGPINNRCTMFPLALGRTNVSGVTFDFIPFNTLSSSYKLSDVFGAWSTHNYWRVASAMAKDALRSQIVPEAVKRVARFALFRYVVFIPFLMFSVFHSVIRDWVFTRKVKCDIESLSSVMATRCPALKPDTQIGLLKIDVEGAEWEVLQGLSDADYGRVRQFVIEVHNFENRCDKIRAKLESLGFEVWIEPEPWETLKLFNLWTVFARRKDVAAAAN